MSYCSTKLSKLGNLELNLVTSCLIRKCLRSTVANPRLGICQVPTQAVYVPPISKSSMPRYYNGFGGKCCFYCVQILYQYANRLFYIQIAGFSNHCNHKSKRGILENANFSKEEKQKQKGWKSENGEEMKSVAPALTAECAIKNASKNMSQIPSD